MPRLRRARWLRVAMKRIALYAAVVVAILLLTKIANQMPPDPMSGNVFSLRAVKVLKCTPAEISLVDMHQKVMDLEKDESWPECSEFPLGEAMDLYLSRGEKTRLLRYEKSSWWRNAM